MYAVRAVLGASLRLAQLGLLVTQLLVALVRHALWLAIAVALLALVAPRAMPTLRGWAAAGATPGSRLVPWMHAAFLGEAPPPAPPAPPPSPPPPPPWYLTAGAALPRRSVGARRRRGGPHR